MQIEALWSLLEKHPFPIAAGAILLVAAVVASRKARGLIAQFLWLSFLILLAIIGYRLLSGGHLSPDTQRFQESGADKSSGNPGHLYYRDPMADEEGKGGK